MKTVQIEANIRMAMYVSLDKSYIENMVYDTANENIEKDLTLEEAREFLENGILVDGSFIPACILSKEDTISYDSSRVKFEWSNDLAGKKAYVADSIPDIKRLVNSANENNAVILPKKKYDDTFPFYAKERDIAYMFAYLL